MEILQNEDINLSLPMKVTLMQLFSDQNYIVTTDVSTQSVDEEMHCTFIESLLQL